MRGRWVTRQVGRFLAAHADIDCYLRENPDVAETGVDPVAHWCRFGAVEGRRMPGIVLDHPDGSSASVQLRIGDRRVSLRPDPDFALECAFEALVDRHADGEAYLAANEDVRSAGLDPFDHWFTSGLAQGRRMPGIDVRLRPHTERRGWERFRWRGEDVLVRAHQPLPEAVQRAILAQAQNEPGVLATGAATVGSLRRVDAMDLYDRDGLDLAGLLDDVVRTTLRPRTVVVADRFARLAQAELPVALLADLAAPAPRATLLLITDEQHAVSSEVRTVAGAIREADTVLLRAHLRPGVRTVEAVLARLLHALAPAAVIRLDLQGQR